MPYWSKDHVMSGSFFFFSNTPQDARKIKWQEKNIYITKFGKMENIKVQYVILIMYLFLIKLLSLCDLILFLQIKLFLNNFL